MRTEHAAAIEDELEWVVSHFEEEFRPDHVFILGDIIQHSETAREDRRNLNRVANIMEGCSFPVTYLLGNHDVINLTRGEISDILNQPSFFGEVSVEEYSFVYLDSSMRNIKTPSGMIGPEQLAFAEKQLSEADAPFVLVHHPVGNFDLSENYWFADFPEQAFLCDRKRLLEIMGDDSDVISTITGHIHQHQCSEFHGVSNLSVFAFSKETPNKAITGAYAEIVLKESVTADINIRDKTIERYEF